MLGLRVLGFWSLELRVLGFWSLGFKVLGFWGLGLRVLNFGVWGLVGFRVAGQLEVECGLRSKRKGMVRLLTLPSGIWEGLGFRA